MMVGHITGSLDYRQYLVSIISLHKSLIKPSGDKASILQNNELNNIIQTENSY